MTRKNKEKFKEVIAAVCPFHPNTIMKKHEGKGKDGKITKGVHCPKCFCTTPKIKKGFIPIN